MEADGAYLFLGGAVLWFGMRESVPSRKRPPQTGQTPVSRAALSRLTLVATGAVPVPAQLPSGTPTRMSLSAARGVSTHWRCSILSSAAWLLAPQRPSGFRCTACWKRMTAVLVAGVSTPVIGPE